MLHRVQRRTGRWPGRLGWLLLVGLALSWPATGDSGDSGDSGTTGERPRIGLALSGGGAKGCAHVGVLKVLEEYQIPVDYIAGTSIGSIVGGLYAAGYQAEQLAEIVLTLDWEDLLEDEPARRDRAYLRKLEDQKYILGFEFGFKGSELIFPSGLRRGQKLLFELRRLSLPVAGIDSFSEFPVPFAAVTTDINNGEMVVLDHGDLAMSLRASMAIPGVFSPVELGGHLLVDGGLVRNIPVDVVRNMGADIVIAVDIGEPLLEPEELRTLFDFSSQAMGVIGRQNDDKLLADADIILTPDVGGMGGLDFSRVAAMIAAGEDEARQQSAKLVTLAVPDEQWAQYLQAKELDRRPMTVAYVQIEGLERVDERILRRQLHVVPGQPLDLAVLERDLNRIFGLGDFELVDFKLRPSNQGFGLIIAVTEKSWGPRYLHTGLNMTIDDDEHTTINLLANLTIRPLNALAGEWRTDLAIGRQQRLRTGLLQPLDFAGRFFFTSALDLSRDVSDVLLEQGGRARFENTNFTSSFGLGVTLGVSGEAGLYVYRGQVEQKFAIEGQADSLQKYDTAGFFGQLTIDRLDSVYFPRRGMLAAASLEVSEPGLGASADYQKMIANFTAVRSWGRHTLVTWLEAGATRGDQVPVHAWFPLGGLFSFSGYDQGELFGPHYGVFRPIYICEVARLPSMIGKRVLVSATLEAGNVWSDTDEIGFDNLRYAATIGLGAETVIGPAYLSLGIAEGGRSRIYLAIGPSFGGARPGY